MAKTGRAAPEPAADASLTALVDAERRFEERLAEARRQAAAEDEALALELRALDEREALETAAQDTALVARIAAARDGALAELVTTSDARLAAWARVEGEALDDLAERVIDDVLAALGLEEEVGP